MLCTTTNSLNKVLVILGLYIFFCYKKIKYFGFLVNMKRIYFNLSTYSLVKSSSVLSVYNKSSAFFSYFNITVYADKSQLINYSA